MPAAVHDWTRVDAGIWHAFHLSWASRLLGELNAGLLPRPYYALAEPQAGFAVEEPGDDEADTEAGFSWWREGNCLALQVAENQSPSPPEPTARGPSAAEAAAWGVETSPGCPSELGLHTLAEPAAAQVEDLTPEYPTRRLSIRHASGHRVVALVEFASPGNRDSAAKVDRFAGKVEEALLGGVHVLLADLFPPNGPAPAGLHGTVLARFGRTYLPPPGKPLCCAAYRAGPVRRAYAEPLAVGDRPPTLPLFLTPDRHIPLDLAPSYASAFATVPWYWREVIEGVREHAPPPDRP